MNLTQFFDASIKLQNYGYKSILLMKMTLMN
jgi:hypothetical protein